MRRNINFLSFAHNSDSVKVADECAIRGRSPRVVQRGPAVLLHLPVPAWRRAVRAADDVQHLQPSVRATAPTLSGQED